MPMFLMNARQYPNRPNNQQPNMLMQIMRPNRPQQPTNNANHVTNPPKPEAKPMKWGAPTWTFLHTMAEMINEEYFPTIRNEMFAVIVQICTNLPCPICSNHAREYLSKINVGSIQTKQDMKHMLFVFHNTVNARKSFETFPVSGLDKYKTGDFKAIANNFMTFYQVKTSQSHLFALEMNRQQAIRNIKKWIIDNLSHFE
jgi:hypothetical protein